MDYPLWIHICQRINSWINFFKKTIDKLALFIHLLRKEKKYKIRFVGAGNLPSSMVRHRFEITIFAMVRKTNTPNMDPNLNILIFSSYKKIFLVIICSFTNLNYLYIRNNLKEKLSQFIASGRNYIYIKNTKRILISSI